MILETYRENRFFYMYNHGQIMTHFNMQLKMLTGFIFFRMQYVPDSPLYNVLDLNSATL
jgi:hypothetical protein